MGDKAVERVPPISLPTFMSDKCVLIAWIASFGVLILLSFFTFIPIAVTIDDTDGNCFLYADFTGFGASSICSYCIACIVIFLIICGLRLILLVMKIAQFATSVTDKFNTWFNIWGVHLLILCLDVLLLVLLLVTSCLLSAGLSMMCENLFKGRKLCSSDYGVSHSNGKINTTFYTALTFAEVSAWLTLFYWLVVTAVETFLLYKDGTFSKVVGRVRSLVHRQH